MKPLLAALAAVIALTGAAFAPPALACTIDTCSYTQPLCSTHAVDCSDLSPVTQIDCIDNVVRRVCIPSPPPMR
ncbi:MAG TPA: hypothetical protein VF519_12950 [Mycobacteriales bacterium]